MLKVSPIHTLLHPYISAASGLLLINDHFHVVADDELCLIVMRKNDLKTEKVITLFDGVLSQEKELRKNEKPDIESLVALPSGDILCVPSGSKANRKDGALISGEKVHQVSFEKLYADLATTFSELNIEGAVIMGHTLRLFQRGNGKHQQNATIDVELTDFFQGKVTITNITHYQLGHLAGVPLSFTDASLGTDRIYFVAVAENSESTYLDGEVKGSMLGAMTLDGKILSMDQLAIKSKPEGLCTDLDHFYLVTDDDDRSLPSVLYRGSLET